MNFAEIQKQEQEQERRAREAAMSAHQLVRIRLAIVPRMARFPPFHLVQIRRLEYSHFIGIIGQQARLLGSSTVRR